MICIFNILKYTFSNFYILLCLFFVMFIVTHMKMERKFSL